MERYIVWKEIVDYHIKMINQQHSDHMYSLVQDHCAVIVALMPYIASLTYDLYARICKINHVLMCDDIKYSEY